MPIVGRRSWMLADGVAHLEGRMILKDAFTVATARRNETMVREAVEGAVQSWPQGQPVRLHRLLRALGLRIIVRTIFGDEDSARVDELYRRLLEMLEITASIVLSVPPTQRLPYGRKLWRNFVQRRGEVDALLFSLIDSRRRDERHHDGTLGTLLDARDAAGLQLSPTHVRDSVMSVIVAGHETTASALAWALLLLAHAPDAQRKAADEIDHDAELPYLRAVVFEALRHRPVFVFAIPRVVSEPTTIGDHTYPPSVYLMPSIYLIQHDPGFYSDPHQFRPERFLGRHPDPDFWLPWGGGRKRCPGRHLAFLEMQTVIRVVLKRFTLEPFSERLEGGSWRSFIVTPQDGARVVLRRRDLGRP